MVLRDWQPLTASTPWSYGLKAFEPGVTATWKLFGGSANTGQQVVATVHHAGMYQADWALVHALIAIDGQPWPNPLPGHLYVGAWPLPVWSCVIHFPVISHGPAFGGVHSLLLAHRGAR